MLHGFLGCKESWQDLLGPFLCEYSFVLVDLPGHGQSPSLPQTSGSSGFKLFDQAFKKVLKAAGVSQYRLYGYSLGGRLALYHASQQPAGLKGLMLESCHPGLKSVRQKLARQKWQLLWQKRIRGEKPKRWLESWYQQRVFACLTPSQRAAQILQKQCRAKASGWVKSLSDWAVEKQPNLWSLLREPVVPTHFLVGTQDPNYVKLARRLRRLHWPLKVHISRKGGHNVHATSTHEWHQVFRQWLTRN